MEKAKPRAILLSEVARKAGVSTATASMALRARGRISPTTRDHVLKVAKKLGYRTNLAASMLAQQKGHALTDVPVAVIGMGTKFTHAYLEQPFFDPFVKHAEKRGFAVEEYEMVPYPQIPKLLRVLYHRGVRGIVLNHDFDTTALTKKDAMPFSWLIHGQPSDTHRFHSVSTEVFESTRFLWETIWKCGYKRIGAALFRHPTVIPDDFAREAAVHNCQTFYDAPKLPTFTGQHHDTTGFIRWVHETKPDAIISFGSWQYQHLVDAGFRVPEQIAFAALHIFDSDRGKVTGLFEDHGELARVAAVHLDDMIRHNETGFSPNPHQLRVSPFLNDGMTLPARASVRR
jgi:LacI family transcriptional regulator